jgi:hypothetical protein
MLFLSRNICTSFALAWPLGPNLHAYSSCLLALAKAIVLPRAPAALKKRKTQCNAIAAKGKAFATDENKRLKDLFVDVGKSGG